MTEKPLDLEEYDVVRLVRPLPGVPLSLGARGTILAVYEGGQAFEVEFCDGEGATIALETVAPADVAFVSRHPPASP